MRFFSSKQGFTLVELAIVLTIIGLVIGGVLKGMELLYNARMVETMEQAQAYQGAMPMFRDKYGSLPGDMPHARKVIPGCDLHCPNVANSLAGNGKIGADFPPDNSSLMESQAYGSPGGALPGAIETQLFWQHLAFADIISGVDPLWDYRQPAWGKTHPSSPLNGGVHLIYFPGANFAEEAKIKTGHYLHFRSTMSGNFVLDSPEATGLGTLSPYRALIFDRKFDDGFVLSGYIFIAGPHGCEPTEEDVQPDQLEKSEDCQLYIYSGM